MTTVASIVEGDGEVAALPVLLRRLADWRGPVDYVNVLTPIRVYKDRFLNRPEEFSRHLKLAAAKCGDAGWILILFDADDDCPAEKGATVLAQAQAIVPHRRIAVVLANREYEAWFIAAAESLNGCRGFQCHVQDAGVEPDFKLLAQCDCEAVSHMISEDASTLAKYLARARDTGLATTTAVLLRDGFDAAWFENGQKRLLP